MARGGGYGKGVLVHNRFLCTAACWYIFESPVNNNAVDLFLWSVFGVGTRRRRRRRRRRIVRTGTAGPRNCDATTPGQRLVLSYDNNPTLSLIRSPVSVRYDTPKIAR